MRRIGEIALAQGFSQERLAKHLGGFFGLQINGANVRAHFQSKHPRRETVEHYARCLGLTDDQLYVIEHGVVPPDREPVWEQKLFTMLRYFAADFEPGVAARVKDALLDPATRQRVFAEMAGPPSRRLWEQWVSVPQSASVPQLLQAAAVALFPELDLRAFVRKQSPHDNALVAIYAQARGLYQSDEKARAFVDVCAAILRLDGFDTRPMYRDALAARKETSK
jgi:hypothetical protein